MTTRIKEMLRVALVMPLLPLLLCYDLLLVCVSIVIASLDYLGDTHNRPFSVWRLGVWGGPCFYRPTFLPSDPDERKREIPVYRRSYTHYTLLWVKYGN